MGRGSTVRRPMNSLDQQLADYRRNRMIAMPIAGTIAWAGIGVAGAVLPMRAATWAVFIGTSMIFYLGLLVARFTGEDLLGKRAPNFFDRIFFHGLVQAVIVYAIAIPFFMIEPTSLPMTVGILTGLMWIPLSALLGHWVGLFHAVTRTVLIVAAWYLLPEQRFVAIPAIIVAIYLVTIYVLERRFVAATATSRAQAPAAPAGI